MTENVKETISVGVVGAGYFAQFHHEAWARMDDVCFSAICDLSRDNAQDAADRHSVASVYTDSDAFLAGGPYDIIDIATPPGTHLDLIRKAVFSARVVICQKPFCLSLEEANEAAAISNESGVPIVVHENFRFQPWYPKIKQTIADGLLGDLYQATFRLRPGDGQGPEAYLGRQPYFQKMQRFLVHETAIHWVDVFRFLFGEPEAVFADLRRLNPAIVGEDSGLVVMRFKDEFRAIFDGNRLVDHVAENRRFTMGDFVVEGSKATLRLDGDGKLFLRPHGENAESEIEYTFNRLGFGGDSVYRIQRHVVDNLTLQTDLVNEAGDYLKNIAIEADIYQSNEDKMWIKTAG